MDGISASQMISSKIPNTQVVMMSVQGESDYLRRSMLAGAREFLIKPFSGDELVTSIRRVHQLGATRRVSVAPPPVEVASVAAPPPQSKGGKVIAVFGAKGGCGASTIAINLAVALREETKERVALVDANFEFGDVAVLLNLPGNRTIVELIGDKTEVDEEVLDGIMASHSSGVKVLLAPPRPELAELIKVEHLKKILQLLARSYAYVVIDLWSSFHESTVFLLDAADQILLVAQADISSIKNVKLFFELTEALGYKPEKTLLLLNKDDKRTAMLSPKDIEASIKHRVSVILPKDERTVMLATNRGVPFITAQRTIPLTQALLALARLVQRTTDEAKAEAVPLAKGATVGRR